MLSKILILTGPTGIGKTNISIKIAQNIGDIELVSADSMQIYQYMNIGTDKPNINILKQYKHHCIDIIEPGINYDVMSYTKKAYQCLDDIITRNKKPIIVGGSGLYLKSLINPLFEGPGQDKEIRNQLYQFLKEEGKTNLFMQLQKNDPEYANKISPNDIKRVIRALEIFYLTGKPLSFFHKKSKNQSHDGPYNYYVVVLLMNRQKLYQMIEKRVDQMIEKGLIEETKKLIDQGYVNSNAMKGLGYKQIILYLQGDMSREKAIELIKKDTRHFAKRQISWFKNQMKVDQWINLDEYHNKGECAKMLTETIKGFGY